MKKIVLTEEDFYAILKHAFNDGYNARHDRGEKEIQNHGATTCRSIDEKLWFQPLILRLKNDYDY